MRRLALALSLAACDAEAPPPSTGGVSVPDGPCGRGLVLVASDYQSTNVALLGLDGAILSSSFISSGVGSAGLSAPLSGDVVAPTSRARGSEIVLIDRFPAAVLTFVDLATAAPRAQLDVSTGFAANPQDYLELAPDKAYVSRLDANAAPGAEPFDGGSDVLVIDPRAPAITGRVALEAAMADAPAFLPRPNRMVRAGDAVYALLSAYSADFSDSAPSRLVRIDPATDAIAEVLVLAGLHGCAGLAVVEAVEPLRLAVACSGKFGGDSAPTLTESAIAIVAGDPLAVVATYPATPLGAPIGLSLALARGGAVLSTALGAFGLAGAPDTRDRLLRFDAAGAPTLLLESASRPFELGEVACALGQDAAAACGSCFVADAERGAVHRLDAGASAIEATLPIDDGIGLPPRYLGRF